MLSDDDDDEEGGDWRNAATWIQNQIQIGTDPRDVLRILFSDPSRIPEVDDITLWKVLVQRLLNNFFIRKMYLLIIKNSLNFFFIF